MHSFDVQARPSRAATMGTGRWALVVIRKIQAVDSAALSADLEAYRQLAITKLGASDAKVISTACVVIDERVRMKCSYPKCRFYGTNAHCPPHAMDLSAVRKIVGMYQYGIFIRLEVPTQEFSGPAVLRNGSARGFMKIHEIVTGLESRAFYDGYHLAVGFACGACKSVFCPGQPCSALVPGNACRHPSKARGSMECAGMDVFTMASSVGWDVYPIGGSASPSDIPCAASYGLVLIH